MKAIRAVLLLDLKYTIRLMFKKTSLTILTLFIIVGSLTLNIYSFSLIRTTMLQDLPYEGGERIVRFFPSERGHRLLFGSEYLELKEKATLLEHLGVYDSKGLIVKTPKKSELIRGTFTEPGLMAMVAQKPLFGRFIERSDQEENAEPVVVLSYQFWAEKFNSHKSILGTFIEINKRPVKIIGVMPKGFRLPVSGTLWLPLTFQEIREDYNNENFLNVFGKIKANVSIEQVNDELEFAYVTSFSRAQLGDGGFILILMILIPVVILLLACINVANVLLSRSNERIKETSVRFALGAPRRRLIIQMMWESVLLSCFGGLIAILLAGWALELTDTWLNTTINDGLPFWYSWELDRYSVIATLLFIVFTILITGVFPAWKTTRGNFNTVLRDGSRGLIGKKSSRTKRLMLIFQIILVAILLFIEFSIFIISYQTDKLFSPLQNQNRLQMSLSLPDSYHSTKDRANIYQRLFQELQAGPLIDSVKILSYIDGHKLDVEGIGMDSTAALTSFLGFVVDKNQLIAGRYIDPVHPEKDSLSLVVSQSFATKYWPNSQALGKRMRLVKNGQVGSWRTVIGVIKDGIVFTHPIDPIFSVDFSLLNINNEKVRLMFQFSGREEEAKSVLFKGLQKLDPHIVPDQILNIKKMIGQMTAFFMAILKLLFVCLLFALALAATGIYGTTENEMNECIQEVGIRRALGASDEHIIGYYLKEGSKNLISGLSVWFILFLGGTIWAVTSLPFHWTVYLWSGLSVILMISFLVLFAVYLPVKRVLQYEPNDALRYE